MAPYIDDALLDDAEELARKDSRATLRSLDLFGMGSLITWLTLLIVSLNMGGDSYAWNSPVIIGLLAGTGASFVAFVAAENYATNPVVPMGLFVRWASRNVPIMTGTSCCPRPASGMMLIFTQPASDAHIIVLPSFRIGKLFLFAVASLAHHPTCQTFYVPSEWYESLWQSTKLEHAL